MVTAGGQVLVAGDHRQGQCGPGAGPAACVYRWVLAGPDARWHGMARKGQAAGGGHGVEADKVRGHMG